MSLSFSHTQACWPYMEFARFRQGIAAYEGIDLTAMHGYRETGDDRPRVPWGCVTTPLKPFLQHSDCDGVLLPAECREIVPRLRAVIDALWPDSCYNREHGLMLAEGMAAAAAADEELVFQ